MSREASQETLSTTTDDRVDRLELRRALAVRGKDTELHSTWSCYRLTRSVTRREPTLSKLDITTMVSIALTDEAAPPKTEKGP